MKEKPSMTMLEHFSELRSRMLWIMVVLLISLIAGLAVAKPIILYLHSLEPAASIEWNVFSPWDTLRIFFNVSLIVALIISLPFSLYQLWAFMKPGLKPKERKAGLLYVPAAALLYLVGLSFGYFIVFPFAFYFTTTLTASMNLTETYGIAQYFSFMFNILLPIALLFELPVVVMFLTRLGLLDPKRMRKFRRYAYLILVVLSTLVTPPDFISPIIVSVPLIILYEFSLLLSGWTYRKRQAEQKRWEEEFGS